jgi:hypothetical protein
MTTELRRAADEDENSAALPSLRLSHEEQHAPTFRVISSQDPLYDLAAWSFHFAGKLPLGLRAPLLAALWRAWPRAKGRRSGVRGDGQNAGTRWKAQRAHSAIYVQKIPTDVAADLVGLCVERTERLARGYIREADAEQLHATADQCDDYGLPRVVLAYPDRDSPDDVPNGALLDAGWFGQMMLSDDPGRYRHRLHTMLRLYREAYRRAKGSSAEGYPRMPREKAIRLWDRIAAADRRQKDTADCFPRTRDPHPPERAA